jgi:hypothetical protein
VIVQLFGTSQCDCAAVWNSQPINIPVTFLQFVLTPFLAVLKTRRGFLFWKLQQMTAWFSFLNSKIERSRPYFHIAMNCIFVACLKAAGSNFCPALPEMLRAFSHKQNSALHHVAP